MTHHFTVYYKPTCPYSIKALNILQDNFPRSVVQKTVINSSNELIFQKNAREILKTPAKGRLTYPQIWDGTRYIGGCDDLVELIRSGELAER